MRSPSCGCVPSTCARTVGSLGARSRIPAWCGCIHRYVPVPVDAGWWQLVPIWEPDQVAKILLRRFAPPEINPAMVPPTRRDRFTSSETWRQAQVPDAREDLTVDGYPRRLRFQEAAPTPARPAPTRINVAGPGTATGTKFRSSRV